MFSYRLARHLQKEAQAQHNNSEFTEEQKVPSNNIQIYSIPNEIALESIKQKNKQKTVIFK